MNILIAEDRNSDVTFSRKDLDVFIRVGKQLAELLNKDQRSAGWDIAIDSDEFIRIYDDLGGMRREWATLTEFISELEFGIDLDDN